MIRTTIKHYIFEYALNHIFGKFIDEFTDLGISNKYITLDNISDKFLHVPIKTLWTGTFKHEMGKTCSIMYLISSDEAHKTNALTRSRYKYFVHVTAPKGIYSPPCIHVAFNEKCYFITL